MLNPSAVLYSSHPLHNSVAAAAAAATGNNQAECIMHLS